MTVPCMRQDPGGRLPVRPGDTPAHSLLEISSKENDSLSSSISSQCSGTSGDQPGWGPRGNDGAVTITGPVFYVYIILFSFLLLMFKELKRMQ